jgi:nicotinamide-nucleotide amidase
MIKELLLAPPPLSLAVAESFTGGCVQAMVTAIPGASAFFRGGITAYAIPAKIRLDAALARETGGVAPAVARQMAAGATVLFDADLAIATTGFAEPDAARPVSAPHGYWALCHRLPGGGLRQREGFLEYPGLPRTEVQRLAAGAALDGLAAYLGEWRALPPPAPH